PDTPLLLPILAVDGGGVVVPALRRAFDTHYRAQRPGLDIVDAFAEQSRTKRNAQVAREAVRRRERGRVERPACRIEELLSRNVARRGWNDRGRELVVGVGGLGKELDLGIELERRSPEDTRAVNLRQDVEEQHRIEP